VRCFLVGHVGLLACPALSGLMSFAIDRVGPKGNSREFELCHTADHRQSSVEADCVACSLSCAHLDFVAMPAKRALSSGAAASAKKKGRTETPAKKQKKQVKEEEPFVMSCACVCASWNF
jgi:hypothetical protein